MKRRSFLSAGAAGVLATTSGFAGATQSDLAGTPETVVGEYYRRARRTRDAIAFADEVETLSHSLSPLRRVADDIPRTLDGVSSQKVLEKQVVETEIDADGVRGFSDFLAGSVGDGGLETLAEENAVVSVRLEDDSLERPELRLEWLVAPEDGAWRLVWFELAGGPETVVEEYYRRAGRAASLEAFADDVERLSHSRSPLRDVVESAPTILGGAETQTLVSTDTAERDIGPRQMLNRSEFFAESVTDEDLRAFASENAIVSATLRTDRAGVRAFQTQWLVAPDGGEWRLVWP